jgi:hypothetical protein
MVRFRTNRRKNQAQIFLAYNFSDLIVFSLKHTMLYRLKPGSSMFDSTPSLEKRSSSSKRGGRGNGRSGGSHSPTSFSACSCREETHIMTPDMTGRGGPPDRDSRQICKICFRDSLTDLMGKRSTVHNTYKGQWHEVLDLLLLISKSPRVYELNFALGKLMRKFCQGIIEGFESGGY